jgi:hypothetical protein
LINTIFVCTACLIKWIAFILDNYLPFAMSESVMNNHPTEEKNKHTTPTLLTDRLEQLGYQCLADSCDRFTTLRLVPIEIKRKEESSTPPSE